MGERLSNQIVEWLIMHEAVAEEDRELYEYAVQSVYMTMAPFFLAMVVGGIMGELLTGFVLILPFMALRKFSGGYHAKRMETCLVSSCTLLAFCTLTASRIRYSPQLCAMMLVGAFWLYMASPIDSENRRLDDWEKRRYKRTAGILALLVCVSSILLAVCGAKKYAVCMAVGLLLTVGLQIPCVLQRIGKKGIG